MKSKKFNKVKFNGEYPIVSIVSDAVIMQRNLADGKAIPLIIIDTTQHYEIEKSIELHSGIDSGEVQLTWGKTKDSKYVFLQVEAIRPVEIKYMIAFEPYKHSGLIEILLNSHLLYIQAGKDGDRLSNNFDKPKLLVEIPTSSFETELKSILHQAKVAQFKELNVKKEDLEEVVKNFDTQWRKFISKRFK